MFWINYLLLCGQVNKAPTTVASELGITSGTVTGWKRGVLPSKRNLDKIADYFDIPVEELLGTKVSSPDVEYTAPDNGFAIREDLRNNYAFRVLYDTLDGATDADMLEAAANIARRKEERNK